MRLVGSADRRRDAPGAGSAAGVGGRRSVARRSQLRKRVEIGLFVSPALALYLVFVVLPLVVAAYYSLYHWSGLGPATNFIGLGNYVLALQDDVFQQAILHSFEIVALSLVIQGPLALGAALLLNRRFPGRAVLRLIFFAPYVISEAITAIVFSLMLQPDGLVDKLLRSVGLGSLVHTWLADLHIVLFTVFAVLTWKYLGFAIILLLAGLQGIPEELTEAAAIDGAGEFRLIRYITLPLLGPTIRIWAFLSIIGSLQLFDLVWLLTFGGPANATNTLSIYVYKFGLTRNELGYGSSAAVILFVICFTCGLLYQRLVLTRDIEGSLTRAVG